MREIGTTDSLHLAAPQSSAGHRSDPNFTISISRRISSPSLRVAGRSLSLPPGPGAENPRSFPSDRNVVSHPGSRPWNSLQDGVVLRVTAHNARRPTRKSPETPTREPAICASSSSRELREGVTRRRLLVQMGSLVTCSTRRFAFRPQAMASIFRRNHRLEAVVAFLELVGEGFEVFFEQRAVHV